MIGPLGFAGKNISRRGFHSFLAFIGLTLSVTSTTFLLLLGQGLATRVGATLSPQGTFGIDWLFFGYLILSLALIIIVGAISTSYLVSSMINQRMRDIGVIKAAGSLPRRLLSYTMAEGMLVVAASCLTGLVAALLIYVAWSWPTVDLVKQVGPVSNAGVTILVIVPFASFVLAYAASRFQVGKIIRLTTVGAMTNQYSGLDLKALGNPVSSKWLGSAFNLAARNVSRDRDFNRTLVRIIVCIFLTVIVLTGALISADTSKGYVQRAMPANVILIANSAVYQQYLKLGTVFSNTAPIRSINYSDPSYILNQTAVSSLRSMNGILKVDTRLIAVAQARGYVKAHLVSNETSGNYNNQYVPEAYLGSTQALIVGIDPGNAIGNWYSSGSFLRSNDTSNTIVSGDSLVGGIVQPPPFDLAQVEALGTRYNVKSAVVDPLNAGRVLYAPVQSVQNSLRTNGYNILLLQTDNSPSTISAVEQFAASNGLVAGSMDPVLKSNLDFLNSNWSYFFILPVLTLVLTSGVLLSYLTTNFSKRFNDYLVLRLLGARAWYSLRLLLWEAGGLLAVCLVIAVPLAWIVSIFFLLPEASVNLGDLEVPAIVAVGSLMIVSIGSAAVYARRLAGTTVKDLRI